MSDEKQQPQAGKTPGQATGQSGNAQPGKSGQTPQEKVNEHHKTLVKGDTARHSTDKKEKDFDEDEDGLGVTRDSSSGDPDSAQKGMI